MAIRGTRVYIIMYVDNIGLWENECNVKQTRPDLVVAVVMISIIIIIASCIIYRKELHHCTCVSILTANTKKCYNKYQLGHKHTSYNCHTDNARHTVRG